MKVVPFKAQHLFLIDTQEAQAHFARYVTVEQAEALEKEASFACVKDGKVLGAFGVFEIWPNRYQAWSHLDKAIGKNFIVLHRAVERLLNTYKGRVEANVDIEFTEGHRWMRMLGFKMETPRMEAFRPDGGDSAMYVRIK